MYPASLVRSEFAPGIGSKTASPEERGSVSPVRRGRSCLLYTGSLLRAELEAPLPQDSPPTPAFPSQGRQQHNHPFQGLQTDRRADSHRKMLPVESGASIGVWQLRYSQATACGVGPVGFPSQAESSVVSPKKPQAVLLA